MPLTLRAVSLNDQPITQPITAQFGAQGGSIGRADTNTLALPDPERRISRRQADVGRLGLGLSSSRTSAAPIRSSCATSRSRSASRHRCAAAIRFGSAATFSKSTADDAASDDRTAVDAAGAAGSTIPSLRSMAAAASWPPGAGRQVLPQKAPAFPPSSPFADLGAPVSAGNPFAELLGDSSSARAAFRSRPSGISPRRRAGCPTTSIPSRRRRRRAAAAARAVDVGAGGAFDDLIPSAAPASIDSLFGLTPRQARRIRSPPSSPGRRLRESAATAGAAALSTDPLALFGAEKDACRSRRLPAPTLPDQTPELRAAFAPPKPAQSRPKPVEQPAPPAAMHRRAAPTRSAAARSSPALRSGAESAMPRRPRSPSSASLLTAKNPPSLPPSAGPPTPSPSGTPSAKAPASASTRRPTPAPPSCASSA